MPAPTTTMCIGGGYRAPARAIGTPAASPRPRPDRRLRSWHTRAACMPAAETAVCPPESDGASDSCARRAAHESLPEQGEIVKGLRLLAIVSVLVLLVTACGRSDENTEADEGGGNGSSDTTAPAAEEGLDQGAFGDLGVVCKEAPEGETLSAGTDPGITADSIQVSTFSDPGFQ